MGQQAAAADFHCCSRNRPGPRADFDELLGDVGEVYWRSGQHDRAIAAWREARRLDPDDGEWQTKLQRMAAGQDPLVSNEPHDWWRADEDW